MQGKILDFKDKVEELSVPIELSAVTMENSYDVILENEDYTLGKALEYYLYETFYKNKTLNFCAFKKLHPQDTSSRIQLAYIRKVSINEISRDLIQACNHLQEVYVAIHGMF